MRREFTLLAAGLAALASAGCASKLYERRAVELEVPDHDQLEVRYGEFDGCLLRQQIPLEYKVKRARYQLRLQTGFGTASSAPALTIELTNAPGAVLAFTSPAGLAASSSTDGVVRYRVDASQVQGDTIAFEVKRGDESLGSESIGMKQTHCRAMSVGDDK